ncbi:hypothetical protein G5I_05943 [Acromyrmex echinatior]|uniref:Uncharacterized protein n=1 Tax=Acromyrmex echinatior TaxID=103372 RepID=F4WJR1_ACREC|nr:hypothetical protein G5I_05943 [Acromyrmex echinatior]
MTDGQMDRCTGCTLLHGARPARHADHETRVHSRTDCKRECSSPYTVTNSYVDTDYDLTERDVGRIDSIPFRGNTLLGKVENSKIDGGAAPLTAESQGKTRRYCLKINGAECREKTTKLVGGVSRGGR